MTKFKKGDSFTPRKPKQQNNYEGWADGMNSLEGKTLKVSKITINGWLQDYSSGYCFHPDWCEKVEENSVNFVQREGDTISIEAPLSSSLTFTHGDIQYQERVPEVGKTIDWEQRRYELAKEFMAAQISGSISGGIPWEWKSNITDAIMWADEMIKQLKQR